MKNRGYSRKKARPSDLRGFIRNQAGFYGEIRGVVDYPMMPRFPGLVKRVYPNAMSMETFFLKYEETKAKR